MVLPAATAAPPGGLKAGQLICSVPEAGDPFARYTVPCTVVVDTDWAQASQANARLTIPAKIHLPPRNQVSRVSFMRVMSSIDASCEEAFKWKTESQKLSARLPLTNDSSLVRIAGINCKRV